jgi:hypothetical protein
MKKLISAICICLFSTVLFAQVPDSISNKFKSSYPNAQNAQWKMDKNLYTATYKDSMNMENRVIYDKSGAFQMNQRQVNNNTAPKTIGEYYKKNYPKEADYHIWQQEDYNGMKQFFIERKNEILYFDDNGKFTKKDAIKTSPPTQK